MRGSTDEIEAHLVPKLDLRAAATMVRSERQNLWEPKVESNDRFKKVSCTEDRYNLRSNVHPGVLGRMARIKTSKRYA